MNDQIVCPNCKKSFPLSRAMLHELEEDNKLKLEQEKKELNKQALKWKEEQIEKIKVEERKKAELQLKDKANEAEEVAKKNSQLQAQLLEQAKSIRQLKTESEEKKLEMEKKLTVAEEEIRQKERERIGEEFRLKLIEKDKKLQDAMHMADDYKRKLEQGSQQLQGEVLELELENMLKNEFPYDEIIEVAKGVQGGDLIQTVKNNQGKVSGTIIWEFKRTKSWSNDWIVKLKEDQRAKKAHLAVIISQVLPPNIKRFGLKDGVWVGEYESLMGMAYALRTHLLEMMNVQSLSVGRSEKKEVLYNYLSSIEFRQRMEAIIEAFSSLQTDIEKEKRFFASKWAKQEKSIRKVIDHTLGMHGDLQSIMGKALADVKQIGLLPEETELL